MHHPSHIAPVLRAIPHTAVTIADRFWTPRLENNRRRSLFQQYHYLNETGVLANFRNVHQPWDGIYHGLFFSDSDAYKWLEAAGYSLATHPDPRLRRLTDELIRLIAAAQMADGYLNTYFQLVEPEKRFTNFGVCHELYTAGHLIEAGVVHFQATGRPDLLNVARRLADLLTRTFGPGKLEAVDGHAGVELALIRLHRLTGAAAYLDLAAFFINARGRSDSRLRLELAQLERIAGRPGKPGQNNRKHFGSYEAYDGRYAQDHLPVREQSEAVGHAVRATYLYCAMADLAQETGDSALLEALRRIWRHVTARRLYVSGGIGPSRANEGFTRDYDLPNDTACAESCAAVGMVFWNHRMLQLTGEGRFADLMERVLYNAFLAGVSLDGGKYFYNNPLQSQGDCHRREWDECACCPPNIARLLASLGGYIYSLSPGGLAVHLYIQSSVTARLAGGAEFTLRQTGDYPWEGRISLALELAEPADFELRLRLPGWCRSHQLRINGIPADPPLAEGYLVIARRWSPGDSLLLELAMPAERVQAHPRVWQNAQKVALQRGPLLYCLEAADHAVPVEQILLPENAPLTGSFYPDLCGGVVALEGEALAPSLENWADRLYRFAEPAVALRPVRLRAVPYYCWDNREPGAMTVWIPRLNP
ncbi:hypothetical protein EDC14_10107 [Hydrogenispora ethanolica]|uniref:Glycoside hydrolase family 127 protein n=1 Tax=Hydrogenispora ethanolica TaxID=1082276 RepID=A0A4R1RTY8_HYDET|nr:beta-L-arabinofuranosidase domain-containing protein [Hydrogenispora ethanolica]TCL70018.1 hypothetical protein EDC14_10107 [Hydrogenispora ethanolica]